MSLARRRFRPMGFNDIVDEAFDLYKTNFVLLVGIAAVLYVPLNLLNGFSTPSLITALGDALRVLQAGGNPDAVWSTLTGAAMGSLLAHVVVLMACTLVIGTFTRAISERYVGERVTIGSAYAYVWRRLGAYIVTAVIFFAVGALTFMLVIFGSIILGSILVAATGYGGPIAIALGVLMALFVVFFGTVAAGLVICRLLFVFPVFMAEGRSYFASIGRAWSLSSGHAWRIFGNLLLTFVILGIIESIAIGPAFGAAYGLIHSGHEAAAGAIVAVAMAIVGTLVAPVFSIVVVLVYYDLRIRKEGFDLEMLARELDASNKQVTESRQA